MQVKKDKPDVIISTELVEHWIRIGDDIWSITLEDTDDDPEEKLLQAFHAGVIEAGLNLDDGMELVPDDDYDDPAPVKDDGDEDIESDGSNNDPPIGEMVDDLVHYEFNPVVWDETLHDDSDEEEQQCDVIDTDDVLLAKGSTMDDVEVETVKTPEKTEQEQCTAATTQSIGITEEELSSTKLLAECTTATTSIDVDIQEDMDSDMKLDMECTTTPATIDVDMQEDLDENMKLLSDDPISGTSEYPIPTVEQDNVTYRHGYIVTLPKTKDGFMILISLPSDGTPIVEEYYSCFQEYV
jgi:hypothetical protein